MNWYKKLQYIKIARVFNQLDWDNLYHQLKKELGRDPSIEEVQQKMLENRELELIDGINPNRPLINV